MLQYIFFHIQPYENFLKFLENKGLSPETRTTDETFEVMVPEDIDDDLSDEIEDEYDRLFEINQGLMDDEDASENDYSVASVDVCLKDGTTSQANMPPRLINKIMEVLSPQEFGEVVAYIVDAVENPDSRTYCERVLDEGNSY